MPFIWIISIAIQLIALTHLVLSRKQKMWIWIIIFLPIFGSLAYFLSEVLPGLKSRKSVLKNEKPFNQNLFYYAAKGKRISTQKAINQEPESPEMKMNRLKVELSYSGSLKVRQELADISFSQALYNDAVELYKGCLTGKNKDDEGTYLDIAYACFYNQDYEQAKNNLERLMNVAPNYQPLKVKLLMARILGKTNQPAAAKKLYTGLVKEDDTLESKCNYALFLKEIGDIDQAKVLFRDILSSKRKKSKKVLQVEAEYIKIAQENVM